MATIRDVARRAGVSAASVSRVLKNDTTFSVSQKTRERILEAAGELGYNKCFEYSAIQGTRGTIGVMLLYDEEEEVEDKFYQIIRVNIKMELEKNGFKVKEVFESMLDANASKISDYQGLIFVGYSTLWYQKKVFRQVVGRNDGSKDIDGMSLHEKRTRFKNHCTKSVDSQGKLP